MKLFFNDLDSLHQYSLDLDVHQDQLQCRACSAVGQWVSHGFVYKGKDQIKTDIVGKRIFCSNRYGRSGCGRTRRLYLDWVVPVCRYSAVHISLFLIALISGRSIVKAYQQATGTQEARHSYRWLTKLHQQLIHYRALAKRHTTDSANLFSVRVRQLQILLPTIAQVFTIIGSQSCAAYQALQQRRFF